VFLDPEAVSKIVDVMPILSMGRSTGRPVATRLAEQLIFSTLIATGVIWINQRDEHAAMAAVQADVQKIGVRIEVLELRMAAMNPLADENILRARQPGLPRQK
jgi:hypothetical protein